jgi:hypothetical protein
MSIRAISGFMISRSGSEQILGSRKRNRHLCSFEEPLRFGTMFEPAYLPFNLTTQRFKKKVPKVLHNVIGGLFPAVVIKR